MEERPVAERYAWRRAYKLNDQLHDQAYKDQRYLAEMFDTLETLKGNKLGLNMAEEFIWSFTRIKELKHHADKCLRYITKVSFNPETCKYDHSNPQGQVLYSTKKASRGHAILDYILIERGNYVIDTEKKEFVLNKKKWKWVDANDIVTKKHKDGWYEKIAS